MIQRVWRDVIFTGRSDWKTFGFFQQVPSVATAMNSGIAQKIRSRHCVTGSSVM